MVASDMVDSVALQALSKDKLLEDFSTLVGDDKRQTARILAYVGEIDRRKLYLEHAYPSMFAFCTGRFRMSESIAAKRIRAGRAACSFPCILGMISRGELHLSGVHQLSKYLTEDNHRAVLRRAKHRTMREIEGIIAEVAPRPDVKASLRLQPGTPSASAQLATLPLASSPNGSPAGASPFAGSSSAIPAMSPRADGSPPASAPASPPIDDSSFAGPSPALRGETEPAGADGHAKAPNEATRSVERGPDGATHPDVALISFHDPGSSPPVVATPSPKKSFAKATPLSPGRYKLQVTIGEECHATLKELQALLSHQIPNGDLAAIVERALTTLLVETKKRKVALTANPRRRESSRKGPVGVGHARGIPAKIRRRVYERDGGKCAFRDVQGRRCGSAWQVEFHHEVPFAKGGKHSIDNIQLRCRAHNQWQADRDFGEDFMTMKRRKRRKRS